MIRQLQIIGVKGIPIVKLGDDLGGLICRAAEEQGTPISDGDIIVVTHKIVSKVEGRVTDMGQVHPRGLAYRLAETTGKPAEYIELALQEAKSLIKAVKNHLITETRHGWIYPYSGVDLSNVSEGCKAVMLPLDSDESARRIRRRMEELMGSRVSVIISDTSGRPFRRGCVNIAVGISGLTPILDLRGRRDLFGRILRIKTVAVADELASAAELVIGQADEKIPVAIVRGYSFKLDEEASAKQLQRPKEKDLFIQSWMTIEALEEPQAEVECSKRRLTHRLSLPVSQDCS